jgi:hypothetical protein
MILLECPNTGERCLVDSAQGYPGWSVLSEDVDEPPHDHCTWCCESNCWEEDSERKALSEQLVLISNPESLLEIIEGLRAEINLLKSIIGV